MVSERRAFGERLKRQRELSGVSLESIAHSTKVAASLFAGLERGDCSRWPAGIYARAYVKAYAEAIGLNHAETLDEYSALFGSNASSSGNRAHSTPRRPPLRLCLADEPALRSEIVLKRVALAATELVVGCLIASVVLVGFGASVWITVGSVLAYYVAGRVMSDEPLLYWVYLRARSAHARPSPEPPQDDVAVGDAASTTA